MTQRRFASSAGGANPRQKCVFGDGQFGNSRELSRGSDQQPLPPSRERLAAISQMFHTSGSYSLPLLRTASVVQEPQAIKARRDSLRTEVLDQLRGGKCLRLLVLTVAVLRCITALLVVKEMKQASARCVGAMG